MELGAGARADAAAASVYSPEVAVLESEAVYAGLAGLAPAPPVVTGRDVLRVADGLITDVYVLADPLTE